jgi:hypothetical protein
MLHLSNITLVAVDCTDKVHLASRAIKKTLEQCEFTAVKLLTHDTSQPFAVKIPRITSLEGYSKFMMRELHKHVDTPHALTVQWDGFPICGAAWTDEFLRYDWGGAPFQPSDTVGNGGLSIRSKRLMEACSKLPEGADHAEDAAISIRFRNNLEAQGIKFMPASLARRLSFEGRSYDGKEWKGVPNKWTNSFAFHSMLSVIPADKKPCKVYCHSGDAGDCVYSLPVIKALGEGVLFLSPFNRYPHPLDSRWTRTGGSPEFMDNLRPLLEAQPYIWKVQYTHGFPYSVDADLNKFRLPWKQRSAKDNDSILKLHMDAFSLPMPTEPWLTVSDPIAVPGRPIVVNRTSRYQDHYFSWDRLCAKYGDQMVFVGAPQEAEAFQGFAPEKKVPHYETKNAMELARVIAGAKLFIGNQSLALAIAHGLHKTVLVEEWQANPNTRLERHNAYYKMPEEWVK